MEMMELNEGFDDSENIEKQIEQFGKNLEEDVKYLIDPAQQTKFSPTQLQDLKMYYYKKKYLKRILDRLDD